MQPRLAQTLPGWAQWPQDRLQLCSRAKSGRSCSWRLLLPWAALPRHSQLSCPGAGCARLGILAPGLSSALYAFAPIPRRHGKSPGPSGPTSKGSQQEELNVRQEKASLQGSSSVSYLLAKLWHWKIFHVLGLWLGLQPLAGLTPGLNCFSAVPGAPPPPPAGAIAPGLETYIKMPRLHSPASGKQPLSQALQAQAPTCHPVRQAGGSEPLEE